MLFDISDLDDGVRHLEGSVEVGDIEWQGGETVSCTPVQLDAAVRKTRRGVEVRGSIETEAKVPCSRCLEPLNVPVRASFRLYVVPEAQELAPVESLEEDPDAIDLYPISGTTIDLRDLVREQIDLALPYRVRCEDVGRACGVTEGGEVTRGVSFDADASAEEAGGGGRFGELVDLGERLKKRRNDGQPPDES
jgi:uncharacterized metal-binding protein YceD (DUF177 family)